MKIRRRKHWGWGYEDEQPDEEALRTTAHTLASHLGLPLGDLERPVELDQVILSPPRVVPPKGLAAICSSDDHARASHALGKSYVDVVNGFRGRFDHPPDFVARPLQESDLEELLEWCSGERVAAIPYGGGTSVVGGVSPCVAPSYNGVISLDLGALDRVLEVDEVSRSARIQAGASGPRLEAQLGEHALTLRHFPQSFELSTLGGWVATRAAGHFATERTHIEDFVQSTRAITPAGAWQSRRLPGSGAGVSPDRMLAGSEGVLGVITEVWVRVQPRPLHRRSAGVQFESFMEGAQCVRALSQSGLNPANCRLIDPAETRMTMAGDGSSALLVLGVESTDHEVDRAMERVLEICAEHGGETRGGDSAGDATASRRMGAPEARVGGPQEPAGGGAVGSWRKAFLGAPYMRDVLVAMGVISETFETAITWERFPAFHERVSAAAGEAMRQVCGSGGLLTSRFTHVYADGPAVYFTVLAPARRGEEVAQWGEIKRAASDAVIAEGGTITHHHAVGRDHRPWYDTQRPDPFAEALRAAKAAVDPAGILNPGVLFDPVS